MKKIRNWKEIKLYIYMIMDLLSQLILNIRKNFYRYVGFLGVLALIFSGIIFLFYSDTENEFIVGQPIHIESYILFTDNQSYDDFKNKTGLIFLIFSGATSAEDFNNWYNSGILKFSETNDALREELKAPYVIDTFLKGTTDVIYHQSGSHEIYTLSNGTKVPISMITVSPRTVGYELKNNKLTVLLALFGILLSYIGSKK
ncbi:MAG: hypothetical protein WA130_18115 [Candidatus Methanoperedens sp.]